MVLKPADRLTLTISNWFSNPAAPGLLLLAMVIVALIWANSPWYESYFHFFEREFILGFESFNLTKPVHIWINDGLMAIFFFTVGLEIKREVIEGQLSNFRKASLPVVAALGGMIVPAVLFYMINSGTEASNAWGIPMATDIAFTLGIIALLGSKVSSNLKVFLTALATVDDIGAILVIALFLTPSIDFVSLIAGLVYLVVMALANYMGVRNMWFYIVVGVLGLWIALLLSGIHATLAGVLAALTIPANRKITEKEYKENLKKWVSDFEDECSDDFSLLNEKQTHIIADIVKESNRAGTPLQKIEHRLNPIVSFIVIPIFALANAGVRIGDDFLSMLLHPVSIGIVVGLVVGKLMGITLFSKAIVSSGVATLPEKTNWSGITGVGMVAGIGFTMSLFIAELALKGSPLLQNAKIGILSASFISAIIGVLWFIFISKNRSKNQTSADDNLIMDNTSSE